MESGEPFQSGRTGLRNRWAWTVGWIIVFAALHPALAATYSGGSGTAGDPYLISTPADLITLSNPANSSDWSNRYFLLTNDIDMNGVAGFTPIGTSANDFGSVFDGAGYAIHNLEVNMPSLDFVGLFGDCTFAQIRNLGIVDGIITGRRGVGAIAGRLYSSSITECYATGNVTGTQEVGGLVGSMGTADLSLSFTSGSVSGANTVGGLAGTNGNGGKISACYSTANVNASSDYAGGFIGSSISDIIACYSTGTVTCNGTRSGGFCGSNSATFGGIAACFWDSDTSGRSSSSGGIGLSTAQMKSRSNFQDAGWVFYDWVMLEGEYPRIAWEGLPGTPFTHLFSGSGTEVDPYLIGNASDWLALGTGEAYWSKAFLLTTDLDLNGISGVARIGNEHAPFTGILDGGGHVIRNLSINLPDKNKVGLFGWISESACQLKNLGVQTSSITGRDSVGGLVGENSTWGSAGATISSCFASASTTGRNSVGGLVGSNVGTITTCYASGTLSASGAAGGLAGTGGTISLDGSVYASYATCVALSEAGGLVGDSNAGNFKIFGSFWDAEATNTRRSAGGRALTSAQMRTRSIFQDAGWGAYPSWVMQDGQLPRLAWESTGAPPIPPEVMPWSGSGMEADPYLIDTPQKFAALSWHTSIIDKHIQLAADLDCKDIALYPIGDLGAFTGVFDGKSRSIRDLTILQDWRDKLGAFSLVDDNGEIRAVNLVGAHVEGRNSIGGLAGVNYGLITSCHVSGIISSAGREVGGLLGVNYGFLHSSTSEATVTGLETVGGLIGVHAADSNPEFGSVSDCSATGTVTGTHSAGGLIGTNVGGQVQRCYTSGDVTATTGVAGGLVASQEAGVFGSSVVEDCFSTSIVTGKAAAGGLAGNNGFEGIIKRCYATGPASADSGVGGLAGICSGAILQCYATGAINGTTNLGGVVGELVNDGFASGTVTASFWDTTTGGPDNGHGTGLPTAQMKQRATFESAGWAFSGATPKWFIYEDQSYPYLLGLPVPVESIEALQALSSVTTGNFYLTNDLDARDTDNWTSKSTNPGFQPIGTLAQPFNGTLDGRGHRILGLHIYRPALDGVGLIGCLGASGVVRGIGLDAVTITGGSQTGGLVGRNQGLVEECYVQGTVSGTASVGGLAGENSGTASACYAAAAVSGTTPGGLVEVNTGAITDSFWDIAIAGTATSAGGTGLSTAAMRAAATYTGAGWDFIDTWAIVEGQSYPYFQNSLLLRVITPPAPLINADAIDIGIETYVPGLFVTAGGGAYPAYRQSAAAATDTIQVPLKQEAINTLRISAVSETGTETVIADYRVYESDQFPTVKTPIASLSLQPATATLAESATQQFNCTVFFAGGASGVITPAAIWNAGGGGSISNAGFYTHGPATGSVQALLNTHEGWVSSNIATITTAKSGAPKVDVGQVSGVVRSHYTGLGLAAGRVTAYNLFVPTVSAQHNVLDDLGNFSFAMPEGKYHFEGACPEHRSVVAWGGQLLESRELIHPGPPEEYSDFYYTGQVKLNRALTQDFDLRPNDTGAPWVVFIEPVKNTTVNTPNVVVTAIDADQYSELNVATYTHNTQEHAIPDKISSTGFYRETWPLQLGVNVLHLYTMDTETNASERTIQITYDPDYTAGGDTDGDGMPDVWEIAHDLDETIADGMDGADGDLDGDGLTNLDEYLRGTLPNANHSDADGLTDGFEVALGTDPTLADTDGDGIDDDVEWLQGSNPLHDDRVKMIISNLANGQAVRGDAVTLLADVQAGYSLGAVESVSIELRGAGTGGVWRLVDVATSAPFAVTWDTSTYPAGNYEARAVATSTVGAVDATPTSINVSVSAGAAHFERMVSGIHTLSASVTAAQPTVRAIFDGTRFARITIPAGALGSDDTLTASFPDAAGFTPSFTALQQDAELYLSVSLATHAGNFLNGKRALLEIGYVDADRDDHLDGSGLRVPFLSVGYLPTPTAAFVALPVNGLDRLMGCVTGETSHFSTFGVIEEQPAPPLNLLTTALPDGTVGAAYSAVLETFGGASPLTFSVAQGSLPPGLGLSGSTLQGTPSIAGEYTFTIEASDTAAQTDSGVFTIQVFAANQPSVTVNRATGQTGLTKTLPANWTVSFSEPVSGFGVEDVALSGTAAFGAAFTISGGPSVYTLSVTGLAQDGTLHPSVIAGGAASIATAALNRASANEQEIWVDRQKPQGSLTCAYAGTQSYTPSGPVTVRSLPIAFALSFDEDVYGLVASEITFAGSPPGLAFSVFGGNRDYSVLVTALGGPATLTPTIVADAAADLAGNGNYAGTYTGPSIQYAALPTVTINQAAGQADPAKTFPIVFDILFDQPVTGFATGLASPDVVYTGSAPSPQYQVTGSGATYTLSVLSTGGDGILSFVILDDVVTEGNAASTSTDNSVRYDGTIPTVTVNQAPGQADPTRLSPVNFQILFSEPVFGLANSEISFAGTAAIGGWTLTGNGSTYALSVHPVNADGTIVPYLAAGVCQDLAGNLSEASTSTDNTVTIDTTAPTVDINQAPAQADPVNALPVHFELIFDEPVVGLDTSDLVLGGTAGATAWTLSCAGTTCDLAIISVTGDGTIVPSLPSGRVHDLAGNPNTSAKSTDNAVVYDATAPVFANLSANPSPAGENAVVTVTFTASEPLNALPAVTVNGNASVLNSASGNTYTYAYTVSATDANGPAAIAISGFDFAGNNGTSLNATALTIDKNRPTANFTAAPRAGLPPLSVQFADLSTPLPGAPLVAWSWDFGDGSPAATGQSPAHNYTSAGVYTVSLTVQDGLAGNDTETKTAFITVGGPKADFAASPTTGSAPLLVQFTDQSDTGGSPITTWLWDFGDGNTSALPSPAHLYTDAGNYTVSLTVTNSIASDTETKFQHITVNPGVPPVANFTAAPTFGAAPLSVQFTDTSAPGTSPIDAWDWDFGDGETSSDQDPLHVYDLQGEYTVTLTVTTAAGSDTYTRTGYIVVAEKMPGPGFLALAAAISFLSLCGAGVIWKGRHKCGGI
jgi:PKD repeat protein